VPSSVNITEGMPATIQVVSNGDEAGSGGGLYQVRLLPRHSRETPNNVNPNPATSFSNSSRMAETRTDPLLTLSHSAPT